MFSCDDAGVRFDINVDIGNVVNDSGDDDDGIFTGMATEAYFPFSFRTCTNRVGLSSLGVYAPMFEDQLAIEEDEGERDGVGGGSVFLLRLTVIFSQVRFRSNLSDSINRYFECGFYTVLALSENW